jgi:hypothetical protein
MRARRKIAKNRRYKRIMTGVRKSAPGTNWRSRAGRLASTADGDRSNGENYKRDRMRLYFWIITVGKRIGVASTP